ncbi:MAG: nucleotide exchange factor GrpE [Burkholderiaceae bacterium]
MSTSDNPENRSTPDPENVPASAAPGTQATESGADPADPAQALAAANAKASENYDLYMRAVAEAENVRRRAHDEVSKAHKFAVEAFAEALLPVMDSLEMALKVEAPTVDSLREGTEATLRLLSSALEKNRVVAIDPVGEKFDPNVHQAISMVPASAVQGDIAPNHVASVLQKGYLIHERVIRPALVMVVQG